MEDVIAAVLGVILVVAISGLLLALPVFIVWNLVVPDVFGLPTITFWQALGISMLTRMLFAPSRSGDSSK